MVVGKNNKMVNHINYRMRVILQVHFVFLSISIQSTNVSLCRTPAPSSVSSKPSTSI